MSCVVPIPVLVLLLFVTSCPCYGVRYIASVTPSYHVKIRQFSTPFSPDIIAFPQNVDYRNHFQKPISDNSQSVGGHNDEGSSSKESDFGNDTENYEEFSEKKKYANSTQIPLSLIEKLNQYTDVDDVLQNIVEGYPKETPAIESRFGEVDEEERSAAIRPKPAQCMPELTTVKLMESDDPSILYFPSCTRIELCGGCCKHPLLSCQPTEVEIVNYMIHMFQYNGGDKFKFVSKEIVPMERHLKCKCGCKVQEKDCNRFQKYNPSTCKCSCPNTDEKEKCLREIDKKLWNPDICVCQCREVLECSTGQNFDRHKCQCVPHLRRRYVPEKEGNYENKDLSVVPLYGIDDSSD